MACCGGTKVINQTGDPYEAYPRRDAMWVSDSEGSRPVWGVALINGKRHYYGYHDVGDVFLVFDADIIASQNSLSGRFVAPNGQPFSIDGATIQDPAGVLEIQVSPEVVAEAPEEPQLIESLEDEDEIPERTKTVRRRRK